MRALTLALAFTALSAGSLAGAASAQTVSSSTSSSNSQAERVDAILGALFGAQAGSGAGGYNSLDTQWTFGRFPLANQRAQFESRIDSDVRSGAISPSAGDRAKSDYRALVDLEARYGADRRFTSQERAELTDRYNSLTEVLAEGGYAGGVSGGTSVADGRTDFEARVDQAVRARKLTRAQGTALKTQYGDVVRLEATYMRDGVLTVRERDDLEAKLDALDAKLPDYAANQPPGRPVDPRDRLEAVARALPSSGLSASAQTQLRVEHADLTRLAAAYERITPSADDRSYLDQRIADLESRVRLRR